jgi:hypothetical protein
MNSTGCPKDRAGQWVRSPRTLLRIAPRIQDGHAAVDLRILPVDVATEIRRQEQHRCRYVARRVEPPEGSLLFTLCHPLAAGYAGNAEGHGRPRRHTADSDTQRTEFYRRSLHERDQGGFSRAICAVARSGVSTGGGGDEDHHAAGRSHRATAELNREVSVPEASVRWA